MKPSQESKTDTTNNLSESFKQAVAALEKVASLLPEKEKVFDPLQYWISTLKEEDIILRDYSVSVGLTPLNVDEFKHRYDTPEVKNALVRLFQIYNNLLERYKKAKKYRSDKQFSGIFPGVS